MKKLITIVLLIGLFAACSPSKPGCRATKGMIGY